jgi:Zn ribbon nucleic-acid-binding protein
MTVRLRVVADQQGHLACPFCNSYDENRLFVASLQMDSCECTTCGARWDEDAASGEYKGRANRSSVLLPRQSSS